MPKGYTAADGDEDMDVEVESLLDSQPRLTASTPLKVPVKKSVVMEKPSTSRAAALQLKANAASSNQSLIADYLIAKAAFKSGALSMTDKAVKRTADKGDSPRRKNVQLDQIDLSCSEDDEELQVDDIVPTPRTEDTHPKATGLVNKACTTRNVQTTLPTTATGARTAHLIAKPAPLFLVNVPDIMPLLIRLDEAIGRENFTTKPSANHGIRVQCKDIATHRKLVKYLDDNKVENFTFQLKCERGFRAIIRHLHHTTPDHWIREHLAKLGHQVRFLRCIKSRFSKEPLDLFEVELVASDNNAELLQVTAIGNQRVVVERPYKSNEVAQCHRCQKFGHTKNYCRRPFACVKCGQNHASTDCGKQKGDKSAAKCANCSGPHAASYRGCPSYKEACKKRESDSTMQLAKIIRSITKPAATITTRGSRANVPKLFPQVPPQQRPQAANAGPSYAAALRAGLQSHQPAAPAVNKSQQRQSRQNATRRAQQQQQQQAQLPRQASAQRPAQPNRSRSLSSRRRRPPNVSGSTHPNNGVGYPRNLDQPRNINVPVMPTQFNSRLEAKIDKLIEMMTTLTTCLLARFGPYEHSNMLY